MTEVQDQGQSAEAELKELEDRISIIEKEIEDKNKNILPKISAIGGLFAIFISLVTGSYTIYDRTVLRPSEILSQNKQELRSLAESLSKLQDYAIINIANIKDPMLKEQAVRSVNTRVVLGMQRARQLINILGPDADVGELLVFGFFEANLGNLSGAKDIFEKALNKGAPDDSMKAEILVQLGQFYMYPGAEQNISKGREFYKSAESIYRKRNDPIQISARIKLLIQWAFSEKTVSSDSRGACNLLAKASQEYDALAGYLKAGLKDLSLQVADMSGRLECSG